MSGSMTAVTEEQAKAFYVQGPNPDIPASLKIDAQRPPDVYPVKGRAGKEKYAVSFYYYIDAQVHQAKATKYSRKRRERRNAGQFYTREEAEASKYRAVYNYVMARSPKT